MSDKPDTGPDPLNLRMLSGMLPSLVKGLEEKRVGGKGVKVQHKKPTKHCRVCGVLFAWTPSDEEVALEPGVCERCRGVLNDGYIAFTCGGHYAFCKSKRLADMAGTVQEVSGPTMEKMKKEWRLNWETKTENEDESDGEPPANAG